MLVSIPQAIGTVTSLPLFSPSFGQGLEMYRPHRRFAPLLPRTLRRIPQTIGTVATTQKHMKKDLDGTSFNTASGKYCCNYLNDMIEDCVTWKGVSIPQAVSTVATVRIMKIFTLVLMSFNTASGRYCCNIEKAIVLVI